MGGGERGNCVCMILTDVHLSSVRFKSAGVTRDTFPNIGFQVAMFVKSHRGDGEMSTLNMLTGHVLHTPGHAHGSPPDMSTHQPPLTRYARPPPEQR